MWAPKANSTDWPAPLAHLVRRYGAGEVERRGAETLGYPVAWITGFPEMFKVIQAFRSYPK